MITMGALYDCPGIVTRLWQLFEVEQPHTNEIYTFRYVRIVVRPQIQNQLIYTRLISKLAACGEVGCSVGNVILIK